MPASVQNTAPTTTRPRVVALIPARGGSKGLPGKNLRELAGKPLIAWTIAAALASRRVTQVVVSTDAPEIATVARACGAEVPFLRPERLAGDVSSSENVVAHAIHWLRENQPPGPEYLLLLQPTSPLRTAADIDGLLDFALARQAAAVVSVSEPRHHPCYARRLLADGTLELFIPPDPVTGERLDLRRRQDLPPVVTENGSMFLCRCDDFLREQGFFFSATLGYPTPPERALDIDTLWEFNLADMILRHSHEYSQTL